MQFKSNIKDKFKLIAKQIDDKYIKIFFSITLFFTGLLSFSFNFKSYWIFLYKINFQDFKLILFSYS